jgi:hypothetical protein
MKKRIGVLVDENIIAALPWICHPPKKRTKFDETFVKHHRLTACSGRKITIPTLSSTIH